jgi:hypothetical protein
VKPPKKRPGRPAAGLEHAVTVFLTKATYRAIDKFAEDHKLTRSEAIRQLLKMGLKSVQKAEM